MGNFNFKKESLLWVLMIIPLIYLAYVWNALPESVPIHFDGAGTPNGWGSKTSELLLPAINLFIYVLLLFIPKIDPKKMNADYFQSKFYSIRFALTFFFSLLTGIVIHAALPGAHSELHWLPAGVFLFLSVMGYFMIDIKPNWFIGIRTPWTLSSDAVWKKTHQLCGRIWMYGGLLCFALTFILHGEQLNRMVVTFVLGSAVFFMGYSFWLYKKEDRQ